MTIKVLSQTLNPDAEQDISVPVGSMMLHARELLGNITVWYRCDDSAPLKTRMIALRATGDEAPAPNQADYVGTAILDGGATVWHVFERVTARV